jgi:hypothetical protein
VRLLLLLLFLYSSVLTAQEIVYPADSLTTIAAIPRDAVKIPRGKASGPNARLQYAIYRDIRYPKSALTGGTSGKIIVYGVVESTGYFRIDSASLFQEQGLVVIVEISVVKKKIKVDDFPKKWSVAQRDLVREALRISSELPNFKPATIDGRPVASRMELPVEFKNLGSRF